ncbi:hypothetical protein [Ornithinimicrobium sufpigmenti]|uniref:hypothetical protein n=1 Tax=Ornithinimicrobium sufpigmenti TaxID=2508882 RepID=UPI0010365749|nr:MULTISPECIES: hypothetical protein [unclassified Ornithinimicrobium]
MESSELLREADRAAASPFVDRPKTPWWYEAVAGLLWGALAVVVHLYAQGRSSEASAVLAALIVLQIAMVAGLRRRWGVWPRMTEAPPEVRAAHRLFLLGLVAAGVVAAVLWWLLGWLAGVIAAACATALVHSLYGRWLYPRAAAEVRERLR